VRRPDGLVVGRCDECALHYLPEVPSDQQIAAFYEQYSSSHQPWHRSRSIAGALRAARRRRSGNGILREIGRRRTVSGARLLEIGCSRGSFLLDAREAGAAVFGMEIDADARRFVADLGIHCSETMTQVAAEGPYDIIVALNVIEHLTDPRGWLRQTSDALTTGGLLVLWTPNAAQADTLGAGWIGFRVDLDHLTYFSARTLTPLLVDAGLWPEAVWEISQAELSGFRNTERTAVRGPIGAWRAALTVWLKPAPNHAWALPQAGGGYTLCVFAGKP
jgi:SAM-dependent methyltransferase